MIETHTYYLDMVSDWSTPEPTQVTYRLTDWEKLAVDKAKMYWNQEDRTYDHVRVIHVSAALTPMAPPTATAEIIWEDGREVLKG